VQDVALDACCLINLYAAGKILAAAPPPLSPRPQRAISRPQSAAARPPKPALEFNLHIPAKVSQEALYILKPDADDATKLVKAAIDLTPILQAGLLHTCDVQGQAEADLFVQLATTMDDGEAMCLAIAKTRGWMLATDDRKATRLATQLGVTIITTPELVQQWADHTKANNAEIASVLRNIQTFARFVPRQSSPLHAWWVDLVTKAK
jgi:predicted nucleic acid-binding protein